ncbi:MAG: hypothetical protein ABFR63_11975 [Thermodesulfobacteriota bacterium]
MYGDIFSGNPPKEQVFPEGDVTYGEGEPSLLFGNGETRCVAADDSDIVVMLTYPLLIPDSFVSWFGGANYYMLY